MTRAQQVADLWNSDHWPHPYEESLMHYVDILTVPFQKLDRPNTFNWILKYVTGMVAEDVGRHISLNTIKKRLHGMKAEYNEFVQFTHKQGVRYNVAKNRIKVSRAYWEAIGKRTNVSIHHWFYAFQTHMCCLKSIQFYDDN